MTDLTISEQARELLAAEMGDYDDAHHIISGETDGAVSVPAALRAIEHALSRPSTSDEDVELVGLPMNRGTPPMKPMDETLRELLNLLAKAEVNGFDPEIEQALMDMRPALEAMTGQSEVERAREALGRLIRTASLLQQNSEGCAGNHYGEDIDIHGLPGWLLDTKRDIEIARAALFSVGELQGRGDG